MSRAPGGRDGVRGAAARAVALADRVLPGQPWEHEQWPACMRLLEHALSGAGWAEEHDAARELTARVLTRVGQYQSARAEYATARELLQRALAIKEAVYWPENSEVASTLSPLGVVQPKLGELDAARVTQERALAILEGRLRARPPLRRDDTHQPRRGIAQARRARRGAGDPPARACDLGCRQRAQPPRSRGGAHQPRQRPAAARRARRGERQRTARINDLRAPARTRAPGDRHGAKAARPSGNRWCPKLGGVANAAHVVEAVLASAHGH
jgi:Tetratricopeptide repeat